MLRSPLSNLNPLIAIQQSLTLFDDGIGPVPITEGSTPQEAQDFISAKGLIPFFSASFLTLKLLQQLHH